MVCVAVNSPKTPVTEGSGDLAPATLPNPCKMPGPLVTPLPNLGQSSDHLTDCTTTVLIEGKKVAIKGSYYMSSLSGDMASKSTGGGVVSSCEEGKTGFAAPGSMNVKAEGKNIQLLGDAMLNNGSNPYNSGTAPGNKQSPALTGVEKQVADQLCEDFCDYIAKTPQPRSSKDLEHQCAASGKYTNVEFTAKSTALVEGTSPGVAAAMKRAAVAGLAEGNYAVEEVKVQFDAVLLEKPGGNIVRIYDFKLPPKDRWHSSQKQYELYKDMMKGKEPVSICPATCGDCKTYEQLHPARTP
jgi:uncharacterized Zn-binding protein involved in type VI secretion